MGRPVYAADEADGGRALRRLGAAARDRLVVEDPTVRCRPTPTASGHGRDRRATSPSGSRSRPSRRARRTWSWPTPSTPAGRRRSTAGRSRSGRRTWPSAPSSSRRGRTRWSSRYRAGGVRRAAWSLTGRRGASSRWRLLVWPGPVGRRSARSTGRRAGRPAGRWAWPSLMAVIVAGLGRRDRARAGASAIHRRWTNSFHRFTWGAGIEAIDSPGLTRDAVPAVESPQLDPDSRFADLRDVSRRAGRGLQSGRGLPRLWTFQRRNRCSITALDD